MWFGVDFGKHMHAKYGILDMKVFDTSLYFNAQFPCQNKASRLEYGESLMTHAMVFTGVHVEKRPSKDQAEELHFVRYRVENSHGDDKADKGYLVMTDEWFDEYLYEVVVDRKFLTKEVIAVMEQEPVVLKAWDPMGALARCVSATSCESVTGFFRLGTLGITSFNHVQSTSAFLSFNRDH